MVFFNKKKRNRRGFTLIEILVVFASVVIFLSLILVAIQNARVAALRLQCINNQKNIGIALLNYHFNQQCFPPGMCKTIFDGKLPYLSWNSLLLPYLEQNNLLQDIYQAFEKDTSFLKVPPHINRSTVVKNFVCPGDSHSSQSHKLNGPDGQVVAFTNYLGVEGTNQFDHDGILFVDSSVRSSDITDGLSSTLLVGERPPSQDYTLGWWYAGWGINQAGSAEMVLGVREMPENLLDCPPIPAKFKMGTFESPCEFLHFWSYHPGGSNFLFADGSVRFLTYEADAILPALATKASGDIPEVQS